MVSASDTDTDFTVGKTGGEKTAVHAHWQTIGGGTNGDPTVYFGGDLAPDTLGGTIPAHTPGRRNWQANRGTDFIAKVKTITGNKTVWRATVKSQTLNHYATTDIANNAVEVILPEGNNHRSVSTIQPYVAVYVWRRTA